MKGTSLFRAFTLCAVSAVMAVAQTPQTTTPPAAETKTHGGTTKSQPSNKTSPDAAALGRRITAISLLTNLADEALGFRDPALRVRVEARVADALWGGDEARARQLFLRAWDELQSFEKEGSRNSDGESSGNTDKRQSPIAVANLRGEVLRL